MKAARTASVRLEPIDAALVPLWYRLPRSARQIVRRAVRYLGRQRGLTKGGGQ